MNNQKCFAQLESNFWYFGDKTGLDFSTGISKVNYQGQLKAWKGCTALSDSAGNLIAYSNGNSVWNKNHALFINGTQLNGSDSASQSSLLMPQPFKPNNLFLFTVDRFALTKGLNYSQLNVSSNQVVQKNISLNPAASEKLSAVFNPTKSKIWIYAHEWNNNNHLIYQLDSNGLTGPNVISLGDIHGSQRQDAQGCAKFSPSGNYLISAIEKHNKLEIYSFDSNNGNLSLLRTITTILNPLGICFSPDETKVYVTSQNFGTGGVRNNYVWQINLPNGNPTLVGSWGDDSFSPDYQIGTMQLGLDGKIYIARKNSLFLGVIEKPNLNGNACSFIKDGFNLESKISYMGVPDFVQTYIKPPQINFSFVESVCEGNSVSFHSLVNQSVIWDFGDGTTDNSSNPNHIYSQAGNYIVTLKLASNNSIFIRKTITILPKPVNNLQSIYKICKGDTFWLDAGNIGARYFWSNGYTSQRIPVLQSKGYSVKVYFGPCEATYITYVEFVDTPKFDLPDTNLCGTSSLLISAPILNATYLWSDGSTQNQASLNAGNHFLTTFLGNCSWTDSFNLTLSPPLNLNLQDTGFCALYQNSIVLDPGEYFQYYWHNQSQTTRFLEVTKPGIYTLTVYDSLGCSETDSISVKNNCEYIYIPTAFSPNNDGINDCFKIYSENLEIHKILIYNVQGNLVYKNDNIVDCWDGNNCEEGVYVYQIEYSSDKGKESKSGSVSLVK